VRILFVILFSVSLASVYLAPSHAGAQTAQDVPGQHPQVTPKPGPGLAKAQPLPFSVNGAAQKGGNLYLTEFRSPDQMTRRDRDLEAEAEPSIRERAGLHGLELNEGVWGYQQLVCSALANHLFLKFTRNGGAGDVSVFTVSIPRDGYSAQVPALVPAQVRVIPILRRSYSLFSPAPINAITISAFNHIRAEEHFDHPPDWDWLATGLCYAALAGAHPQVAPANDGTDSQGFPTPVRAILKVPVSGGTVIEFTDLAATPNPMDWALTFNSKGVLLKATHTRASVAKATEIPRTIVDPPSKPTP